jgi:putative phosphoesterase
VRIAVISDTHDRLPRELLTRIAGADEIWHLGDVTEPTLLDEIRALGAPLHVVRGNCDAFEWPLTLDLVREGVRFHLVHIPPATLPPGADAVLHGHTHVPRNETVAGVRFLNPGCITRPNRGAPASYAWLEVKRGQPILWRTMPATFG